MLERMHPAHRLGFSRDCLSAWRASTLGVTPQTTKTREKYWNHWRQYAAQCHIDPWLTNTSPLERDITINAFAARVRSGFYGRGAQVKVQSVNDALSAISKTIELAGQPSPLYREANKYQLSTERLCEGFRREDPPAVPQLAVPVSIVNHCYKSSLLTNDALTAAAGQLTIIAFYYLLRVGEYTQPRTVTLNGEKLRATRTVQFSVDDVGFWKDNKQLPKASPLDVLLTADSATLQISNQKNGRMGESIHQWAIDSELCPVKALARRIHHILKYGGSSDSLICDYFDDNGDVYTVTSQHIIKLVRTACKQLMLHKQGIDPDLIGAHSLRAGGAMALALAGFESTVIMKMGRWTSLTFQMYIHNQIAHLSKNISQEMSKDLPFMNIAAIERA